MSSLTASHLVLLRQCIIEPRTHQFGWSSQLAFFGDGLSLPSCILGLQLNHHTHPASPDDAPDSSLHASMANTLPAEPSAQPSAWRFSCCQSESDTLCS